MADDDAAQGRPTKLDEYREEIKKLASLDEDEYALERGGAAKRLKITLALLDKRVAKEQRQRDRARRSAFFGEQNGAGGAAAPHAAGLPYRYLGYGRDGEHYFFNYESQQVVAGPVTKYTLLQIAPIDYWQSVACTKRGTVDWDTCISTAIHANYKPGRFKAEMLRARGAWLDGKTKTEVGTETDRIVLHFGDRLVVDGAEVEIRKFNSTCIYELGARVDVDLSVPPLTVEESRQVLEIGKQFLWTSGLDAYLFCGWIAVAPLCGILSWRPHIWLTGPSAAGKTEILNRFVKPLTPFRFESAFSGGSTEAGLRQSLGRDALAVIYDEAESRDDAGRGRLQKILLMLRGASSSGGDKISKGTTSGRALDFNFRSSVLLSSIYVPIEDTPDQNRISRVEIRVGNPKQWAGLKPKLAIFTPSFGTRFFRRMLSLAALLLKNIATFQDQTGLLLGNSRAGQQYGALLAGAYMIGNDDEASPSVAKEYVESLSWDGHGKTEAPDLDECRCLASILGAQVPVTLVDEIVKPDPESNATWQPYARTHRDAWTLGELIAKVLGFEPDKTDGTGLSQSDARDILARYGIRTGPGTGKKDERIGGGTQIWIANRNDALSRAIAKHPWGSNGWHQYLARLPGATKSGAEVKKFAGSTSCWVSLPRGLIDRED